MLQRTMLAASEQGRGLAELSRSSFGYTVALATLARGSVEALSRANWVLSSGSADEMLIRHASLEYADLRYPLQHGLAVRHQGKDGDVWVAVDAYRQRVEAFLAGYGLRIVKAGLTELATNLMGEIYNEAPQLYSGMSAAAHGQGWATGNFFDNEKQALRRDDQMAIEYCAYVIEATTHVTDKFLAAFQPDRASAERWISERHQVDLMLRVILQRRDNPFPVG
ncbi:MAG TPA: hypothetical protein VHX87_07035 [Galbitalea sp.]|nr:hypothetical protein [Galbitalea sp.]